MLKGGVYVVQAEQNNSSQMCASSYKLEVKNIKLLSPNLKTSVLASENLTSADETILFGT